jgi:hypothetical protein
MRTTASHVVASCDNAMIKKRRTKFKLTNTQNITQLFLQCSGISRKLKGTENVKRSFQVLCHSLRGQSFACPRRTV